MAGLIIALVSIAVAWVVLIRPVRQRNQEHLALVASVQAGDRIVTAGGVYGTVVDVAEDVLRLEVASGVVLTVARAAVHKRVDAGAGSAEGHEVQEPRRLDGAA